MKNPPGEDDNEAASSMTMLRGLKMPGLLTRFLSRVKAEGKLTLVLEICKRSSIEVKLRFPNCQAKIDVKFRVMAEVKLTLVLEICKWECQAQVKSRSKQGQVEVCK